MFITDIAEAQTVLADNDIQLITFSHNICYDISLGQMYFNDFQAGYTGFDTQMFGRRQTDYMIVYSDDVKKTDKYFAVSQLKKMRKDELLELCEQLEIYPDDCDKKADLIDYLTSVDYEDFYKSHYQNSNFYDLDCDLDITGYSQGDRVKIKLIGQEAQSLTDEGMTNLFYDTPISGNIDVYINGELVNEIYADEILPSSYDYFDKDDFIRYVADYINGEDYKDLLLEYLEDNLPSALDYK